MNDEEVLLKLQHCGKAGLYREAMHHFISHSFDKEIVNPLATIQYAVALQHYGRYLEALSIYQDAIKICSEQAEEFMEKGVDIPSLVYNLKLQTAVLFERLLDLKRAIDILDEIGPPENKTDFEIASASLSSWYYLTRLKCHMGLKDYSIVQDYCNKCELLKGDFRLLGDWGGVYSTLLEIRKEEAVREETYNKLRAYIVNVGDYDFPGQPWLGLVAGTHIVEYSPLLAKKILEDAEKQASILGKFYVIAGVNESLALCYLKAQEKHNIELAITRALVAYNKCQLLTGASSAIRNRVVSFCVSLELWNESDVINKLLQTMGTERVREEIVFSKMCKSHAEKSGEKPDRVFERFVSDWANSRFIGKRTGEPVDMPTADTIIVREVNGKKYGTIVQAKHYANPKTSIPKQLYLRDIVEEFSIDVIERYVFVISSSLETGWDSNKWHFYDEKKIRNLVPDRGVEVVVITEPELQTDVVLSDTLYFKYFNC